MRLLKDTSPRLLFACAIGFIVNCNAVGAMDMMVDAVAVQPEGGAFMQLAAGTGVAALRMLQRAPSPRQLPRIAIRAYVPPIPETRTGIRPSLRVAAVLLRGRRSLRRSLVLQVCDSLC